MTARLGEDPHLWSRTLFDELKPLGFVQSYPTLTRQIRARRLRPVCTACSHVTARPNAVIAHPPREETQFDWLELPDAPAGWGFPTSRAFLLVGSLPYSGKWRAALSPSMDTPHLLAAMTTVVTALGGVSKQVAVRPDADRPGPRHREDHVLVRRVREALRRERRGLPAEIEIREPGTGKGWWRRTITPQRSAGGGRCPTR